MWFNIADGKIDSKWDDIPKAHRNQFLEDKTSEELAELGWIEFQYICPPETHKNPRFIYDYEYDFDSTENKIFSTLIEKEIIMLPNFDEYKMVKINDINNLRNDKLNRGFNFQFSDGIIGSIQMREIDLKNIMILAFDAGINQNTQKTYNFRDINNVIHECSASEILNIQKNILDLIQLNYTISWDLKHKIETFINVDELYLFNVNSEWDKLEFPEKYQDEVEPSSV